MPMLKGASSESSLQNCKHKHEVDGPVGGK
jgi:hypothetical protein